MSRLFPVLLLLLCVLPTWAEEDSASSAALSPEQAATRVSEAIELDDAKALERLAKADNPDPWLVADTLHARGQIEDARKFAAAFPRADVRGLPAYLFVVETHPDQAAQRRLLQRALSAAADSEALVKLLRDLPARPTVTLARLSYILGRAQFERRQFKASAVAFSQSASIARKVGWLARASDAYYQAGLAWFEVPDFEGTLLTFQHRLEVERRLGSDMGMGRAHYGLYVTHDRLGNGDEAAVHLGQAHALAKRSGDGEYLAKQTASKGEDMVTAMDAEGALAVFESALEQVAEIDATELPARFVPDPIRILKIKLAVRLNAASTSTLLERHGDAREHAAQAHQVAKRLGRPRSVGYVRGFLGVVRGAEHRTKAEHYEALDEYERAGATFEEWEFPIWHADCLRRMGDVRADLGDSVGALESHEQAIEILTRLGAAKPLARAHREAAGDCIALMHADDAARHTEEALRLARRLKVADLEAGVLEVKARLAYRQARYSEALSILENALSLLGDTGRSQTAGFLRRLQAQIYSHIGDDETALERVDLAVEQFQGALQRGNREGAQALRASILSKLGRHDAALELAGNALKRARERGNLPDMAGAHMRLGDLHWRNEAYAEAAKARVKAAGMYVMMGNERRALEARIQAAREVFWAGDRELGIEKLELAQRLAAKDGNPRLLAWVAVGLAESHLAEARYTDAIRWVHDGLSHLSAFGMGLAEAESAIVRENFAGLYSVGVEAAWRANDGPAVFEFVERGRASGLLAALGGSKALREASIPKRLRVAEERAQAAVAVASEQLKAARRAGGRRLVRSRKTELEAAEKRLMAAVSSIHREVRMQADLAYQGNVLSSEIQKALAADEALVLFNELTSSHHLALVVTANRSDVTPLGKRADIEQAIGRLGAGGNKPVEAEAVADARKLLIDRLKLGKGIKRVLISPSPELAYVPFALLDPSREMVCIPSATVYGVIRTQEFESGTKVLAMGDPNYGAVHDAAAGTGPRLRGERGRLTALPGTRKEALAIGDVVLLGNDASETQFREVVATQKRWKAVHFACHGLVDPKRPTRCSLELTADAQNDGSLWALEVFRTRVPADLVVLSGCETGKGRFVRGEGIMGLVRTFMQAGAPRVIASLWNVDDDATQELMAKFYELWNPKDGSKPLPTATALRKAQEHVRKQPKWAHPRYWAAWVLWGRPD